jgi:hypothetical protein
MKRLNFLRTQNMKCGNRARQETTIMGWIYGNNTNEATKKGPSHADCLEIW